MEGVPLPAPEVTVANRVGEAAFALPFPFRVKLPDILSLGEGDIEAIGEEPKPTNKLLPFLAVVLRQIASLFETLSRASNVQRFHINCKAAIPCLTNSYLFQSKMAMLSFRFEGLPQRGHTLIMGRTLRGNQSIGLFGGLKPCWERVWKQGCSYNIG